MRELMNVNEQVENSVNIVNEIEEMGADDGLKIAIRSGTCPGIVQTTRTPYMICQDIISHEKISWAIGNFSPFKSEAIYRYSSAEVTE
ncbi:hypothetical protein EVAR_64388_1 [Eumeta japonica]|uniref:Uncharacterized protein n=1 Tax=Eumeta variegata TaxID=151549 RepID=A0A4C1SD41_EUMVA|nr:hypothetical protein EVAR_64388_1 [Eumeta japonica]